MTFKKSIFILISLCSGANIGYELDLGEGEVDLYLKAFKN
tara:strand:+ start:154 stop:273 length:120 start_codon:yes stop_codon:yes gene_type:complete